MDGQGFNGQNEQNGQNGQMTENTNIGATNTTDFGAADTGATNTTDFGAANTGATSTESANTGSSNYYYQDNTNQYTGGAYAGSAYSEPVVDNGSEGAPGLAIAALVMGIISIVLTCCCGSGIIFGIAGLIMAIVANKQRKSGVGTAGLICSIVGIVFNVLSLIVYFFAELIPMMMSM